METGAGFTDFCNSLPGLKNGTTFAGTSTGAPVLGFLATLGSRCRVAKVPKPRISTLQPDRNVLTMLSRMVTTIVSDSARDVPNFWASSSVSSVLVTLCSTHGVSTQG